MRVLLLADPATTGCLLAAHVRGAAAEAMELGRGGVMAVSRATSLSRTTITKGIRELEIGAEELPGQTPGKQARIRRLGAGRKALTETVRDHPKCTTWGHLKVYHPVPRVRVRGGAWVGA